jgi:hypothetical protein
MVRSARSAGQSQSAACTGDGAWGWGGRHCEGASQPLPVGGVSPAAESNTAKEPRLGLVPLTQELEALAYGAAAAGHGLFASGVQQLLWG